MWWMCLHPPMTEPPHNFFPSVPGTQTSSFYLRPTGIGVFPHSMAGHRLPSRQSSAGRHFWIVFQGPVPPAFSSLLWKSAAAGYHMLFEYQSLPVLQNSIPMTSLPLLPSSIPVLLRLITLFPLALCQTPLTASLWASRRHRTCV